MTLAQRFGSLGKNSGNPVKHTLRPFTTRHNNGLQPTRSASLRVRLNPTVGQRSASGVKQTMPGNKIIDGGAHETVAEDI